MVKGSHKNRYEELNKWQGIFARFSPTENEVCNVIDTGAATQRMIMTSSSAIADRDRAAGWVSYGKKWKTGTGIHYLQTL